MPTGLPVLISEPNHRVNTRRLFTCLALLQALCAGVQAQSLYLRGTFHSHSEYSDGNQANDPAYRDVYSCFSYIKQFTPEVEFWGISDHNHGSAGMARADYRRGVAEADSANADGTLAALYGMEWGVISTGGHVLVYGIDSLIGWEGNNYDIFNSQTDYNGLFNKIAARGDRAFAWLAHMEDTDYGQLLAQPYNATWDDAIAGISLRNGPAFSVDTTYGSLPNFDFSDRYHDLLKKGYHVAPGIDHDNHYIVFGRTHPGRTVVIADSITLTALVRAVRSMRCYASDDWNAQVIFAVNGNGMGSIASDTGAASILLQVNDNEPVSTVKIWYGIPGNGIAPAVLTQVTGNSTVSFTHVLPATTTYYYFAEITQADGDVIWTAPVWYTRNGTPPPLELLSFTAENINNNARLKWSTQYELLMDVIRVEKSPDSLLFNPVATITPTGSLATIANYQWTDPAPLTATTWYRLQLLQLTGLSTRSGVRRVDPLPQAFQVNIFPTIGTGGSAPQVTVTHNREEVFRLDIVTANGQLAGTTVFYSQPGTLTIDLNDFRLAGGMYFLRIFNSDYSLQHLQRFIRY